MAQSRCQGWPEAIATVTRRTETRTRAPILSSLRRIVPAGGAGQPGRLQADPPQRRQQHVGHRGEPQPELVGPHGPARGPVGEQIELAFLDAVLHLAAGAVEPL